MFKLVVLMLALFGAAYSQVISGGSCPDVQVVTNFEAASYLGTWYENARYFAIFEIGTRCSSATYSLNSNGSIHVLNAAVSETSGATDLIEGTATFIGDSTEAKLTVVFPTQPGAVANYYVLDTDYENWAAVFSCSDFGAFNAQFAWLLTRDRSPSDEVVTAAKNAFEAQSISVDDLQTISQENCGEI